jgi:hypothetical protein
MSAPDPNANKKEACKSYLEQTKLLTTLASAFIIAPVAFFTDLQNVNLSSLITMELFFVGSVLCGYIVFGTISGTQNSGEYNVYRPATRLSSILQLAFYITGLILLISTISSSFQKNKESKEKLPIVKCCSCAK